MIPLKEDIKTMDNRVIMTMIRILLELMAFRKFQLWKLSKIHRNAFLYVGLKVPSLDEAVST